jgi:hypothetical protein
LKFAFVTWHDAWGGATEEATVETVAERHKPVPMETAGWVLLDNDLGITLFHERGLDDGTYRGRTFIPRGMVVSVKLLDDSPSPRKPRRRSKVQPSAPETTSPAP